MNIKLPRPNQHTFLKMFILSNQITLIYKNILKLNTKIMGNMALDGMLLHVNLQGRIWDISINQSI